ncbi:S8 family peptidase [Arsenicicoccus dermatophilus]|uniref:S8 family peptidase n=1 Tax=Arsenicicoccus dermatophilus TaxID=1076331 RepID=UPI00391754DF
MTTHRRATAVTLSASALLAGLVAATPAGAATTDQGAARSGTILVLAKAGAQDASVRAAIAAAGGTVTATDSAIGLYTVATSRPGFAAQVRSSPAVDTAAPDRVVGHAIKEREPDRAQIETLVGERGLQGRGPVLGHGRGRGHQGKGVDPTGEPLWGYQWDMQLIHTPAALRVATGKGVRVGVMDTGVDASHPDIGPNFDIALSRNFTKDIPEIDGPCAEDPDGSCEDPATVDEGGHGTHVASTIASPVNGLGIAGVAPQADIVNLRVGQDSGFFFLEPTVKALTYAGRNGIDVVNMSYYIDPWAFNCADNPADTPEQQAQQRLTIEATNRALRYARSHGVTLIAAAGNSATDLDNPTVDSSSPNYPAGQAKKRTIDNSCLDMPTEGDHVLTITSVGPSTRKAYYSSYGLNSVDVAAPGGDYRDFPGTDRNAKPANLILAALPKGVAIEDKLIDPVTGIPTTPNVIKQGDAYYRYLQGTSMAAPHATGVATLIVERYGATLGRQGKVLLPALTEQILVRSATDHACPDPATVVYPGVDPKYTATCTGTTRRNSFYGEGIVDAARAVLARP